MFTIFRNHFGGGCQFCLNRSGVVHSVFPDGSNDFNEMPGQKVEAGGNDRIEPQSDSRLYQLKSFVSMTVLPVKKKMEVYRVCTQKHHVSSSSRFESEIGFGQVVRGVFDSMKRGYFTY